ncbi:MAG: hypothetical protein EXR75_06210 [Myxococcales bacterium]|nr:hypothetical protein [Myxococcales bacterium]
MAASRRQAMTRDARHANPHTSLAVATAMAVALGLSALACTPRGSRDPQAQSHAAPHVAPASTRELTILYTADEHGWIAARNDRYASLGGATQLLSQLIRREGHCPGSLEVDGAVIAPGRQNCAAPATVLLSGGDNYTGPVLSTYFRGRTMADTLRLLGYSASAFGNHEFDFGHEAFETNRARANMPYLSANIVDAQGQPPAYLRPWLIVERAGVRLGVVGLTTEETPKAAMPHRFLGLTFRDLETSLARAVPEVWDAGADAVVVIAHECHDVIAPIIARHPEWALSFAGTGHCHRTSVEHAGATLVIAPDWRMEHYARIRLRVDPSRPARERTTISDYALIDVSSDADSPYASAEPRLDDLVRGWQTELDRTLGEVIGHSRRGVSMESELLGSWVVRAWQEHFPEVDAAITTRGSIRQELPAGPITLGTVHSILPFDNELVVCDVPEAEFAKLVDRPKVVLSGVRCENGTCRRTDGRPLSGARLAGMTEALLAAPGSAQVAAQPGARLRIVTTDFLFHGGDGFNFQRFDEHARFTKVDWRAPVIEATRRAGTTTERPLEQWLATLRVARPSRGQLPSRR